MLLGLCLAACGASDASGPASAPLPTIVSPASGEPIVIAASDLTTVPTVVAPTSGPAPGDPAQDTTAPTMPTSWYEPYGDPADYGAVYSPTCTRTRIAWNDMTSGPDPGGGEQVAHEAMTSLAENVRVALAESGAPAEVIRAADALVADEGDVAATYVRFYADRTPATLSAMQAAMAVTTPAKSTISTYLDDECAAVVRDDSMSDVADTTSPHTAAPATTVEP